MRGIEGVYLRCMKSIKNITHIRPPAEKNIRCERDEVIQKFVDRLNAARVGTKYPPLKPAAIAVKLSHLSVSDLWAFYGQCEHARSFSRYFWWAIKAEHV